MDDKIKNDKVFKFLRYDGDLFEKYRKELRGAEFKLFAILLKSMSNSGRNKWSTKTLIEKMAPYKKSAYYDSVKALKAKGIVSYDAFGQLYLVGIHKDPNPKFAPPHLTWSELINFLADHTNFQDHTIDECWEWTDKLNPDGYGIIKIGDYDLQAHRLSYQFFNGKIRPCEEVDHKCKNRRCVNPRHLRLKRNGPHQALHAKERQQRQIPQN